MLLKDAAKKIRASQPLNRFLTDSVKFFMPGDPPEFIVRYLPRSGEVKNILPNGAVMRLWSESDEQVTNLMYWRGWQAIEPETRKIFFHLARESRVTFDIGAHVGSYTLLAAAANPGGQVYSFEALPIVYERLKGILPSGKSPTFEFFPWRSVQKIPKPIFTTCPIRYPAAPVSPTNL